MSTKIQAFFVKYKVFLSGLAGAIALSINQLLSTTGHSEDLKIYLYAALMALLSYIATQWRGQGMSIIGVIGTLCGVFVNMYGTSTFTWTQFGLYATVAILALVSPPPKSLSYEHSPTIVAAKEIPAPTVKDDTKVPIGGETIKTK